MNRTKIIATVGPLTYKRELLEELVSSGVDVIRLNMSYSDHEFCSHIIENIKLINEKLGTNVATMLDLEGPCIRTGEFSGGEAEFKTGERIRIYMKPVICNGYQFSVNYSKLVDDLRFRSVIKLMDGKVVLEVVEKGIDYVVCEVIKGGVVDSFTKVYLPGIILNRKFLTKQDREDILFADKMDVDFIGVSNVSDAEDIMEVNDLLIECQNDHIGLIAKIQNDRAIKSLNRIIDVSDGILLARSDLAVELPIEEVPNIKNTIIRKCHGKGKISIITAELDSFLTRDVVPSRSEVSDLANSVSESVDAILLAGETAIGMHPIEAVNEVEKIIRAAECTIDYDYHFDRVIKTKHKDIADTVASSVALGAMELDCKVIIVATNTGYTARQMSKLRPPCIIIAAAPDERVARSLNLHFGVLPISIDKDNFDDMICVAVEEAKKVLDLNKGDKFIITGGYPFKKVRHTNFMKIDEI
ncbi:MAG: pyruvate kinase [Bacilli bacterium]|nr:pyruvate kinase [Bacilli bacterium]